MWRKPIWEYLFKVTWSSIYKCCSSVFISDFEKEFAKLGEHQHSLLLPFSKNVKFGPNSCFFQIKNHLSFSMKSQAKKVRPSRFPSTQRDAEVATCWYRLVCPMGKYLFKISIALVPLGVIHLVRTQNFPKNQHFLHLIRTRYVFVSGGWGGGVRNVSFSENFAYVLNELSLIVNFERVFTQRGR